MQIQPVPRSQLVSILSEMIFQWSYRTCK